MGFMERLEAIPGMVRWLAIPALVLLLGGLYWYLSYQPNVEEIAKLQEQIAVKNKTLVKYLEKEKQYAAFKEEVQALESELNKLLKFLPKSQEIPGLIRQISDIAVRTGLQINLLRPQGEQPKEFYAAVPIKVQVKGSYHSIGYFLDALGRLPRIVSVSDLDIKAATQETECVATTFRYLEEGEAHAEASSTKKRGKSK